MGVTNRELEKLRAKERAHDDYLLALRRLARERARQMSTHVLSAEYMTGYDAAINDLSQFTADVLRERMIERGQ